ncbi:MAG TPA: glucose-6-phosphate dehydrogenase [Burkholderiales bacterium]|nr:glucose-6-phosphate dehydrogenase [Burkholderiales bacterium]
MSRSGSCVFVIFGGTGDLMRRKLLPALFYLAHNKLLPRKHAILAVARDRNLTEAQFRRWARNALADAGLLAKQGSRNWCDACVHYQAADETSPADYQALAARIAGIEQRRAMHGNRILHLALPPGAFSGAIEALAEAGLHRSKGWTRLVIEKPFGHDLASARRLNALVHRHFDETQVYRIDHYLGKETVQNLLAFRFGNALFESAWNRDHVRSVQITVAEALGIEGRGAYYEQTGALRDIAQNHLTQLLTLTAMEVPAAFEADSIRFEKIKVLRSVAPIRNADVVFGQYAPGRLNGKRVPGYRKEPRVAANSAVETFVAMRLQIENWRWQGVPFYLRTGKRLPQRRTQIAIHFRSPPVALFPAAGGRASRISARTNALVITLQPDEGFDLSFEVKSPGERFTLQTQHMEFRYAEAFGDLSAGYETLLLEVLQGDQTLFVHADETEAAWRLYTPLLRKRSPMHFYPAGSWGPAAADRLIRIPGNAWVNG